MKCAGGKEEDIPYIHARINLESSLFVDCFWHLGMK